MLGAALAIVLATSPVHAIIWGGGTSPADAEAQLKDADSTLWQEYFRLAADFPKAVESKTVAGLKPGFHVVIVGFCSEEDLAEALAFVKSVNPNAYARPVTGVEPACPQVRYRGKVRNAVTAKSGAFTLAGATYDYVQESTSAEIHVRLFDSSGRLLDQKHYYGDPEASECAGVAASRSSMGATYCTIGSFETCRGTRYKVTLTVAEGKLVEKSSASPYHQEHCERQGERATPVLGD